MAYTVVFHQLAGIRQRTYENAVKAQTSDGHLYLLDSTSRTIAAFAPSIWDRVEEVGSGVAAAKPD